MAIINEEIDSERGIVQFMIQLENDSAVGNLECNRMMNIIRFEPSIATDRIKISERNK